VNTLVASCAQTNPADVFRWPAALKKSCWRPSTGIILSLVAYLM
jgi:hypothetical protein